MRFAVVSETLPDSDLMIHYSPATATLGTSWYWCGSTLGHGLPASMALLHRADAG
jgi:hypothetical protein